MEKIRDTSGQDILIKGSSRKRLYIIAASIVILTLISYFLIPSILRWASISQSVSAERMRFATVQRSAFVRDVMVQGRVVAAVSPMLYSPAAGTVYLHVNSGDAVTEGQIVATIDSPELSSQLKQEQATLDGAVTEFKRLEIDSRTRQLAQRKRLDDARVALTAADREKRRAQEGFEKGVYAEIDFEQAVDLFTTAEFEFNHVTAETELLNDALAFELETQQSNVQRQQLIVDELQRRVGDLELHSPVNGVVGDITVGERAFVDANQSLLSVVDLMAFELEVDIPESYADALALQIPTAITSGQTRYDGFVSAISPEVQNNVVTGRVRFVGDTPSGLRQNQRMSVRIILESKDDALVVRRGPFYDSGAGRIAYVVNDSIAERREILTGAVSVDRIEILSGLQPGEQIILSSLEPFNNETTVLLNQ